MIFQVYNRELCVGNIDIIGVSSSSLLMVGDAETIQLASIFDTPTESLIFAPSVPLTAEG
jgi:spore germination protein PD